MYDRITRDGPIFVKGNDETASYWLVLDFVKLSSAKQDELHQMVKPTGGLLAIYPHIRDHECVARPERPLRTDPAYVTFRDGRQCESAPLHEYPVEALEKYDLTVDEGTVLVNTSHRELVDQS